MAELKKNYNFGIIGTGYMASEYVKVLKSFKFCKTISVLGSSENKTYKFQKKYNLNFAASSVKQLYYNQKVDFLIICVSEDKLIKIIKKIELYPWKCLFEKPLGVNLKQTEKIVKIINKKKNFLIGLNRRFYHSTQLALKELQKYKNKKRIVEIIDQEDQLFQKKIGKSEKVIKNFMFVNSVHLIDYMNLFCRGRVVKIITHQPFISYKKHIVEKTIFFSSGDICLYKCFWNIPHRWSVRILVTNKEILLKPLETFKCNYKIKNKSINYLKKWDLNFKAGLKNQICEFINIAKKNETNFLMKPNKYLCLAHLINSLYFK